MHSACPYYVGEEMSICAPNESASQKLRFKKFNPIIDMIDERIHESIAKTKGEKSAQQCMDIEDMA